MAPPKLYTMPISHYCVSAERMLAFKGIPAEKIRVPYHDRSVLISATGQDYVPALVSDGRNVSWSDIPDFLEQMKPSPTLYPGGHKGLAKVLEHWGHQVLEERVWKAVVTKVPPLLSSDTERWVFEEMQIRARGPWSVLELRRPEFELDMENHLALVDEILHGRDWLLGEPSLADFGVFGGLSPLLTVGDRIPERFPRLARWVERVQALPG